MKIEIDDKTFNTICGMNPNDMKSFFMALKNGVYTESEELDFKGLKKKIPKNSKKLEMNESSGSKTEELAGVTVSTPNQNNS